MGTLGWVIENHSLILKDEGGNNLIPTAEEIYYAEYKNATSIRGLNVVKPSEGLPFLSFSKYPAEIKIVIKAVTDSENIMLIDVGTEVFYKRLRTEMFGLLDSEVDHIIIDNVWIPFVKDGLRDIKDILKKAKINSLGRVTLKQFLDLRKMRNSLIVDEVDNIPVNKGFFINNSSPEIPSFRGKLYPYQNQGFKWLKMIIDQEAGCILADEMGLGKTAQIIALLASEKDNKTQPSLVIAPVSLLENWRRELDKFAPSLNVLVHQGHDRTGFYKEFKKYDVVITSYEVISRDLPLFKMLKWNIIVADEAQSIKNPNAKRTLAVKQLNRVSTIAVTGTPVENKLLDLWSLSDFVFPGYLGNSKEFTDEFENEVEGAQRLEPLISPILLRRTVKEVANDLPKRIDVPQVIKLSSLESELYESLRLQIVEEYGKAASLVSLVKLRMFCTHPFLQVDLNTGDPTVYRKYMRLIEILDEIIANREKAIVFTSYTEMADILVNDLSKRFDVPCDFIDGRVLVSERQEKIDTFSEIKGPAILVLNPRAAGAGLNITAANHVIHYNLEWNPAVEDQASARAYRRGQTRPVTIHHLYCANTVEEAIKERLERKREISESVIIGHDGSKIDNADIIQALLKSPLN